MYYDYSTHFDICTCAKCHCHINARCPPTHTNNQHKRAAAR